MKHPVIALFCLLSLSAQATEVYMSRDADGKVTFSDKPVTNAEKHEVKELPTVPAFVVPKQEERPVKTTEQAFSYTSLSIISPVNDSQLESGYAGDLQISGVLSPGLRETDTLLLLDRNSVIREGRQTAFLLKNLSRGEHIFQMTVRDKDGNSLISSNPVTVHVHRASVLKRN